MHIRKQHYPYYFILLSLFFHVIGLYSYRVQNIDIAKFLDEEDAFTIKYVSLPKKSKTRQIVENERFNNKVTENAFLGAKNNAVERQTKSATIGAFKEAGVGDINATDTKDQAKKSGAKQKKKAMDLADLSMAKAQISAEEMQKYQKVAKGLKNGKKNITGLGQSSDYVEDIPLGDFTSLNTQEYKFFGFYHRIREKLEQFWGRNIKDQAQKLYKQGRYIASGTKLVTSLEISINDKGEIVRVLVNSTSGVKELDEASVNAFNQAGPFPNPPKELVKNGEAKIRWSFVVNT